MKRFKSIRVPIAAFAVLCGIVTTVGGSLTWISASGSRPSLGISHTSLSKMLVYTFANGSSFAQSVGFAVLVLGLLVVIGAILGIRALVALASLLAIVAGGMWVGLVVHHFNTPDLPNSHYLNPANIPWADLRVGAWLTLGGAVLGLVSALFLRRSSGAE